MFKKTKIIWGLLLVLGGFLLTADDTEASRLYQKGLDQIKAKEYYDALKTFKEVEVVAKSNTIRANSIRAQIGAAKLAGLYWREFELIEALLRRFPEYANVPAAVDREYELGDLYFKGKREPAFYAVRMIPWLVGPDKTEEIYTAALRRAPYADQAPSARLRLAFIYDQKGEVKKSLDELRTVVRVFPKSPSYKLALLALGYGCYEMAVRGDGDGRYARECAAMSELYIKKFPGDPALPMVRRNLQRIRDAQAKRLYEMAEFYRRQGRKEASGRYLARVVREFPESEVAPRSESELSELDRTFTPGDFPADPPRYNTYQFLSLPAEAERVLLVPGEKGNLLPVPDLKEYMNQNGEKK